MMAAEDLQPESRRGNPQVVPSSLDAGGEANLRGWTSPILISDVESSHADSVPLCLLQSVDGHCPAQSEYRGELTELQGPGGCARSSVRGRTGRAAPTDEWGRSATLRAQRFRPGLRPGLAAGRCPAGQEPRRLRWPAESASTAQGGDL